MADDLKFSDFTTGEKLRIVGLVARMAKRGLADDGTDRVYQGDLQKRVDRIEAGARKRIEQQK